MEPSPTLQINFAHLACDVLVEVAHQAPLRRRPPVLLVGEVAEEHEVSVQPEQDRGSRVAVVGLGDDSIVIFSSQNLSQNLSLVMFGVMRHV